MPEINKIAVTHADVSAVADTSGGGRSDVRLPSPVPILFRLLLLPLVLVLPLLSLVAMAAWFVVRNKEARVQLAWFRCLCGFMIASSLVTTVEAGLLYFLGVRPPAAAEWGASSSEPFILDTPDALAAEPLGSGVSVEEVVRRRKPAVLIATGDSAWGRPTSREQLMFGSSFGAAVLVAASEKEYLIVTCRHVIDGEHWQHASSPATSMFVCGQKGGFARATVVGRHKSLDLALLSVPRTHGSGFFVQPVSRGEQVALGGHIVAIGHPQGMFYSVSDGLISRLQGADSLQISAPISPGASGGPVYDMRLRLVGIISSTFDKSSHPQAENLNFAVRADALLQPRSWDFTEGGKAALEAFANAPENTPGTVTASADSESL